MVFFWLSASTVLAAGAFTSAQLRRATRLWTVRLRQGAGRYGARALFFLLKSLVCIALVLFALGWPGFDSPEKPAHAGVSRNLREKPAEAGGTDLVQAGKDALIGAARDRCLSAPRDCAALLQHLPVPTRAR